MRGAANSNLNNNFTPTTHKTPPSAPASITPFVPSHGSIRPDSKVAQLPGKRDIYPAIGSVLQRPVSRHDGCLRNPVFHQRFGVAAPSTYRSFWPGRRCMSILDHIMNSPSHTARAILDYALMSVLSLPVPQCLIRHYSVLPSGKVAVHNSGLSSAA